MVGMLVNTTRVTGVDNNHVRPLRGRQDRLSHPIPNPRLRRCAPYLGLTMWHLSEVLIH